MKPTALFLAMAIWVTGLGHGLARGGILYGISDRGDLYSISPDNAAATFIGDTIAGNTTTRGLTTGPGGQLYETDCHGRVFAVDSSTPGASYYVGEFQLGGGSFSNLAYNSDDAHFYATDGLYQNIGFYRADSTLTSTTHVGVIPFAVKSLTYDPSRKTLFGTNFGTAQTSRLYQFDPDTGAATLVGNIGFAFIQGLAYAPDLDTLFAVTRPPWQEPLDAQLISIDPTTGTGTAVGVTADDFFGLAYVVPEPATFVIWGALGALFFLSRRRPSPR